MWLKRRKLRFVKEKGLPIYATIEEIEKNQWIQVHGKHPYQILAKYVDHGTMDIYYFKSEYLWFDPTPFIKKKFVRIYIDPDNVENYCMDIERLIPAYQKKQG